MFETRDDFAFDYRMHDGSAMRVSHHFGGETQLPVAIQTRVIEPGGFEGYHRHEGEGTLTEFYQVLSGTATMRIGDQHRELHPGDSALAPAGIDHDLVNTGTEPLRVLVAWGPPGSFDMSGFGSHQKSRSLRPAGPRNSAGNLPSKP